MTVISTMGILYYKLLTYQSYDSCTAQQITMIKLMSDFVLMNNAHMPHP